MSTFDKAVAKLLANPPEARFSDVKRVLAGHGWFLARTEGSHHTFVKEGEEDIITVPVHNRKVGRVYIKAVCKRLGLGDNAERE